MYIRRKVFSKLQTEDGQERYFSTTEFTLMSEAEQREFSKKDNKKSDKQDRKMRYFDKSNIKRLKKMYEKDEELKEAHLKEVSDDPKARKEGDKIVMKKGLKSGAKAAAILIPTVGALGYGVGRADGNNKKESLKIAGGGALGATAGAALGIGTGLAAGAITNKIRGKRLEKGKESALKARDQVKTAAGKMTEEEYTEKWGKKKKK